MKINKKMRKSKKTNQKNEEKNEKQQKNEKIQKDEKNKGIAFESTDIAGSSNPPSYIPKAPYPTCLDAPSPFRKKGVPLENIMKVFKQVKINLPLLDAV